MSLNPDSVRAVAKKDFRDAVRSRGLLVLTAVFVVFFTAGAYFFADAVQAVAQQSQATANTNSFLGALTSVTRLFIPLTGIVVAYAAIIGERESGTLRILLSLPNSRADVVAGKLIGRGAVVAVPVLLGFLTALLVFPITGTPVQVVPYLGFALLTVLLGLVFVAIALGASTAASTSRRAVIGTVGLFVTFAMLWGQLTSALIQRVAENTDTGTQTLIELFLVVRHLNPMAAYSSLTTSLTTGSTVTARTSVVGGLQGRAFAQQLQGGVPFYLSDVAVVAILLTWLVVPVLVGFAVFRNADL